MVINNSSENNKILVKSIKLDFIKVIYRAKKPNFLTSYSKQFFS